MSGAEAFRVEAGALLAALGDLTGSDWERPTRCTPWRVRDVTGHVITVLSRVPEMVAAPAPQRPDTDAAGYYRGDHRFSAEANADRVRAAQSREVSAAELASAVRAVLGACRSEPAGRVVRTRHGDAMLLTCFVTTRLVEVAVHGLDLADALDRPPWLTTAAIGHLLELLFGPTWRASVAGLGWDPVTVVRRATGRGPVTPAERRALAGAGLRGLTLG